MAGRVFRVFVSSTFSDLVEERNALSRWVFPKLRALCEQRGYKFQAVDLRWGVRDEATVDQQTVRICLDEIERCQRLSPKPNFIVLLGDRYGWCPPPVIIAGASMEAMRPHLAPEATLIFGDREAGVDAEEVDKTGWYRMDENAVPTEWVLQPRRGRYEAHAAWEPIERRLRDAITRAAKATGVRAEKRELHGASATELEIVEGALKVRDAPEHVFAFVRSIKNKDAVADALPAKAAADLLDVREGAWDQDAWAARKVLDATLRERLGGENVWPYEAELRDGVLHRDGLGAPVEGAADTPVADFEVGTLCHEVFTRLSMVVTSQIEALDKHDADKLKVEQAAHDDFARRRLEGFKGRERPLAKIAEYLQSDAPRPLVVYAESGSGKSALIARAAQLARIAHPNAVVIQRFIGAVPGASEAQPLLESLCSELSRGLDDKRAIDGSYDKLINDLPKRLALARDERPVLLFLDALDQLGDIDEGRRLVWLPYELPAHVRVVVSTLPDEQYQCFPLLRARAEADAAELFELEKLSIEDGGKVLDDWLRALRPPRKLTADQRARVLDGFRQRGLPLYLRLAFEEARRWHSYDHDLDSSLPPDVPGLIRRLYTGLSRRHGPVLVSRTLGFLAAARYGLSDEEMLALLWRDKAVKDDFDRSKHHELPEGDPALPPVIWSRLYFDLEPYLAHREVYGVGLLGFYHRQLGEVATQDYLAPDSRKPAVHRQIAEYFDERWQAPDTHALLELPYHQTKVGIFPSVLTDLSFVEAKSSAKMTLELVDDFARAQRDIGADIPAEDRRRLEEFSSFVMRNRIVLAEMPELTFQQAANEAPETTPAMAATSLWASRLERRPWLKVAYRDGSSANVVASVRCENRLLGATLSADGKRLAILDGDVRVFDVQSNRELLRHPARQGHVITAVALSVDGQQLAQAEQADGEPATCSLWCIGNGARIALGRISLDLVSTIRFDAQGDLLLGGSRANGGGLVRWNRGRSTESWNQSVPGAVISHLSEQDELVVVAQGDGVCSLWHGRDGRSLDSRPLQMGPINAVGVSPSGTVVVSGGADHKCTVWSVGAGRERRSMFHRFARSVFGSKLGVFARHRAAVTSVTFLNEDWVASGDAEGILWVWKVDDERESCPVLAGEGSVVALETSGDRRILLAAFSTDRTAQVLDVSSLAVQAADRRSALALVEFGGPTGALLAARHDGRLERLLITGQRAFQSWEELDSFPDALLWAMSPGKASVLAVNHDSTWRVRDLVSNATFSGRFKVSVGEGALAAISPGGRQIAVYYQERIAIASIQGDQRLYHLPMIAKSMRFDTDDALRIVGFSTRLQDRPAGTVCVSRVEYGAQHPVFSDPLDSKVQLTDSSAVTTAEGFLIAGRTDSGGGRLEIWNLGVDCAFWPFEASVRLHGASVNGTWSLLSCPALSVCHVLDVASPDLKLSSRWKYPLKRALVSAAVRADGKRVAFGFAGGDVEIVETLA